MTLSEFIQSNDRYRGLPQAEVAALLGMSRPYLTQLLSGAKKPGLDLAVKIERLTNGAVPASAWVPECNEQGAATA